MVNSRASGKRILIESHLASGTAATLTFTFPSIDWDKVAYLELEFDFVTTAAFALELIVNAVATNYYTDGTETSAGSTTIIDKGAIAHLELASTAMCLTAGKVFGICKIMQSKLAASEKPLFLIEAVSDTPTVSHLGGSQNSDVNDITGITITTSTSTWTANSRFTLWKIIR